MTDAERLSRDLMAARVAAELQDGWVVNLGLGMPTTVSDFIPVDRRVIFHSENGLIGYGRRATEEEVGPYVVNAGVQPVELTPYACVVHHADSFALIRGGRLNAAVLGAYEVAANGDFANWRLAGRKGGGIGGAMDIAACAQRVFILMEHTTRDNNPRLLERCTLALTAPGVVTRVFTDLGVFEPTGAGFRLCEIAPGWSPDDVQALTGAPMVVPDELPVVQL
jgi:3-oxoacid CoA-transferase B subunit